MKKITFSIIFAFANSYALATSLSCQSKLMSDVFWYVDFNNTGAKIETPQSTQNIKWTRVTDNVLTHEVVEGNIRQTYVLNRVTGELNLTMLCLASCKVDKPITVSFECKKSQKIDRKF